MSAQLALKRDHHMHLSHITRRSRDFSPSSVSIGRVSLLPAFPIHTAERGKGKNGHSERTEYIYSITTYSTSRSLGPRSTPPRPPSSSKPHYSTCLSPSRAPIRGLVIIFLFLSPLSPTSIIIVLFLLLCSIRGLTCSKQLESYQYYRRPLTGPK